MGLKDKMSYYPVAHQRTNITRFLSRKDFENILSSSNVENAVKSIINKPLGLKLYDEMRTRKYGLTELLGIIDRYEYTKLKELYNNSPAKMKKVFSIFQQLYDVFNTYSYVLSIIIGEKPSILFYFGNYPETIDRDGNITIEKLPRKLQSIIRKSIKLKHVEISDIISMLPLKHEVFSLPLNTRIVYGVFHDFFISKLCISGYNVEPRYTVVIDNSILRDICNQSSISGFLSILRVGNTYMTAYGEILELLNRKIKTMNIIDIASLIFGFSRAKSLLKTEEDIATRAIVLSLGEALLTKYSLISVDTGYFQDLVKDIVNRWWPL